MRYRAIALTPEAPDASDRIDARPQCFFNDLSDALKWLVDMCVKLKVDGELQEEIWTPLQRIVFTPEQPAFVEDGVIKIPRVLASITVQKL